MNEQQKAINEMVDGCRIIIKAHEGQSESLPGSYAILARYATEFVKWQETLETLRAKS